MKKSKFMNIISQDFHIYKSNFTVFLFTLWGALSILGNICGTFYLVLTFLPVLVWGMLFINDKIKN